MSSSLKISLIIITYNRPKEMLELIHNIRSLDHKDYLNEVIIINNKSLTDYKAVEDLVKRYADIPFNYSIAEENLGVSGGRNAALQRATAPILVFIDDDALFQNKNALLEIRNIFSEERHADTGIVAFKICYQSTSELQKNAFPHKQFEKRKNWNEFNTYYFSGCAHAIRRNIFETVGYYPETFFYGMEEYDLSYRAINEGFKITYDDRVTVLHKESPSGRLPNKDKLQAMWVNKTRVAWKYLPKRYFYSTALLWGLQYLRNTTWHLAGFLKGWKEIYKIPSQDKRNPLSKQALNYLKKVKARLWY